MKSIDLNCDMGESFGAWKMGRDSEMMNYVSSVNIACGFHSGDPTVIRNTIVEAIRKNVAIGAHPSFPDLQGFGRRDMKLSSQEVYDVVLYQISAVKGICEAVGGKLHHVKPHGALYNMAAKDKQLAAAIAKAVSELDKNLIFYGFSGSFLISEAEQFGLRTVSEVFADRTYMPDGSLTPRTQREALISEPREAAAQVLQMVRNGLVSATDGSTIKIHAETVCIHGDGEKAVEFAAAVREDLRQNGIDIAAI